MDEWVTTKEASVVKKVGLTAHRISELARQGEIVAHRVGKKKLIVKVTFKDKKWELVRFEKPNQKPVDSVQSEQEQGQNYREGTVATVAGQGKLFSIELPVRQAILHQLRVIGSRSSVFTVMVCESANTYVDAMHSNIGIFQSRGRVVQETFRLPDWYYQDKEGGTHLHLEITPLIDQYLKPQTLVEFRVGVWFTPGTR